VSVRAEPEARFALELVTVRWSAAPGSTVKVVVPDVSPDADAVIVIDPASAAVTLFEAIPDDAVAAPAPVTVPAPDVFAKVTEVELSEVTTLSFASRTSAVSVLAEPDPRFAVDEVTTTLVAAPATTEKLVVPEVSPVADAVIVIEPATAPVTVFEAMPDDAVAEPVPVTVPVPEVCVNVTEVELSEVTTLPPASRTSAVIVRVAPEERFTVDEVITSCVGVLVTTVNAVVPEVSPLADAVIVTEPAEAPVTVFDAMPDDAVAEPVPVTVPVPEVCVNETEVELSEVTTLSLASRTSAVIARVAPVVRFAVEDVTTSFAAGPGTNVTESVCVTVTESVVSVAV
jgi:hypothetical protein